MVRFIIVSYLDVIDFGSKFTFQYGQIYYRNGLLRQVYIRFNLHSNMVRFIIGVRFFGKGVRFLFTFQYGQIYYAYSMRIYKSYLLIYIPIWLDLLCTSSLKYIPFKQAFTFQYGQIYYLYFLIIPINLKQIYIPIWLDLLYTQKEIDEINEEIFTFQYGQIYYDYTDLLNQNVVSNLHSNMVRFIISIRRNTRTTKILFTFQYGQIYYIIKNRKKQENKIIYIPIWLDLLCLPLFVNRLAYRDLHSNMVRFIIKTVCNSLLKKSIFTFQYGQIYYGEAWTRKGYLQCIYIPIWLDLLSTV